MAWDVGVDSTVCRAHQHAAGAAKRGDFQKEPPGGIFVEPADHGLGRSRGGPTSKIHLAVEQGQKPLSVVVTGGQRGDSPQFEAVLEAIPGSEAGTGRPRERPDRVRADKAYDSRGNPLLPAQTRDQSHHPGTGGPCPQPPRAWIAWRTAVEIRQRRLQAAARGRVRDQPAPAPPGRR
ncbi:transposase [Streptomyces sp. TE33382]